MGEVVDLLDRPVYRMADADRLLRVNRGTVQRWIDGYTRKGITYPPVVREKPTRSTWVTWGEFVEARLLSEFRSEIPMIQLRPLVERLREEFNQRYPLSYAKPFLLSEGRERLLVAQREMRIDQQLWFVIPVGSGTTMTATARRFTGATTFPADQIGPAVSIKADTGTPDVLLNPTLSQGQPTLRGISTAAIAELVAGGEPLDYVADTYGFTPDQVEQAVSFEASKLRAS